MRARKAWAFNVPLYFAYGSNMDELQIVERCPSAKFQQAGVVRGYRLGFTRFSQKRQCGVADLVPDTNAEVWGAVFAISGGDLTDLDRSEGANLKPPLYQRVSVKVCSSSSNETLTAVTYEVVRKAPEHVKPNAAYMALIIGGAQRWGLPQPYIAELKKIEVC